MNFPLYVVCCCITLKNATAYTSSLKLLNKSAMHAVIFIVVTKQEILVIYPTIGLCILLTSSMLHHDVIMTSYCCQRYAECLVMTLCSSRTLHRHTAPRTCNSRTAASRNANLSSVQRVASKQPRSQSCELRDLGWHAAPCLVIIISYPV